MIKLLKNILKSIFSCLQYKIISIKNKNKLQKFCYQLKIFESHFTYPLSKHQRFRIIHGNSEQNYLSFFESHGKPKLFIALDKHSKNPIKVVGAACAVLQKKRDKLGVEQKVWYLCDLKVIPEHQGKGIPIMLFIRIFLASFASRKWYAISMNSQSNNNKIANKLQRLAIKFEKKILNFYFFDFDEIIEQDKSIINILKKYGYSSYSFKDNSDLKSFQIFETNSPNDISDWKILHMQFGHNNHLPNPVPGFTHMLAVFENSFFDQSLKLLDKKPSSQATVMSKNIELPDIILTNEI